MTEPVAKECCPECGVCEHYDAESEYCYACGFSGGTWGESE